MGVAGFFLASHCLWLLVKRNHKPFSIGSHKCPSMPKPSHAYNMAVWQLVELASGRHSKHAGPRLG